MEILKFRGHDLPEVIQFELGKISIADHKYTPSQIDNAFREILLMAQEVGNNPAKAGQALASIDLRIQTALDRAHLSVNRTQDGKGWYTLYTALLWHKIENPLH